ncbi:MAG: tetratricopeptide repeat protein [Chthonomonadales bacterium]|nr:tetratricopeptide repeat protein [Chthonomonadales bacterium]
MGAAILGVYAVALGLIIASIPVVKLIRWWIDGGVDGGLAAAGILLYFGLLAGAMAADSALKVIVVLVLLASAIVGPALESAWSAKQLRRMEDDDLDRYVRVLEGNPEDPVARIALAECLFKRGHIEQAIEHMRWTLERHPRVGHAHRAQLDYWLRERERQSTPAPLICHMCHAENPPGAPRCVSCDAPFGSRQAMREGIARDGGPVRILRGWIVVGSTMLVSMFALIELPAIVAGPIIVGALIVGAWTFLRWVGGDLGRAVS